MHTPFPMESIKKSQIVEINTRRLRSDAGLVFRGKITVNTTTTRLSSLPSLFLWIVQDGFVTQRLVNAHGRVRLFPAKAIIF